MKSWFYQLRKLFSGAGVSPPPSTAIVSGSNSYEMADVKRRGELKS